MRRQTVSRCRSGPRGLSLDSLFEEARSAAAQPAEGDGIDALVASALLAGQARETKRRQRAKFAYGGVVLGVAAATALVFFTRGGTEPRSATEQQAAVEEQAVVPAPPPQVERVVDPPVVNRASVQTLGPEHEMIATSDVRYAIEPDVSGTRVAVQHGAVLFDIAPLDPSASFVVETQDAEVWVVGTVFVVEVSGRGTAVSVFEGRVRVEPRSGEPIVLNADESWGATGSGTQELRPLGQERARERAHQDREHQDRRRAISSPPAPVARGTAAVETLRELRRPTPPMARGWIAAGNPVPALAAGLEYEANSLEWRAVAADALRALRRWDEAADRYDLLATRTEPVDAAQYGLLAAQIRIRQLHDPAGAARSIRAGRVTRPGSPLRERGLALLVEALHTDGDRIGFERAAAEYLASYPHGSRRAWIEARLRR